MKDITYDFYLFPLYFAFNNNFVKALRILAKDKKSLLVKNCSGQTILDYSLQFEFFQSRRTILMDEIKKVIIDTKTLIESLQYVSEENHDYYLNTLLGDHFIKNIFTDTKNLADLDDALIPKFKKFLTLDEDAYNEKKSDDSNMHGFFSQSYRDRLKPEFRFVSEVLANNEVAAKNMFDSKPEARLDQYILIDKKGEDYIRELLLKNRSPSFAEYSLKYIISLSGKEVFSNKLITMTQLLSFTAKDLCVIDGLLSSKHGFQAFQKGFIRIEQLVTAFWRRHSGFLQRLFTENALKALEKDYLKLSDFEYFINIQEVQEHINRAISKMQEKEKQPIEEKELGYSSKTNGPK